MATTNEPQHGSQPGVLGDGTQAQNLGQIGHPEDRVTKADIQQAFGVPGLGEDTPLDAASVTLPPEDVAGALKVSPLDLGSSQLMDIADGGQGHAKHQP